MCIFHTTSAIITTSPLFHTIDPVSHTFLRSTFLIGIYTFPRCEHVNICESLFCFFGITGFFPLFFALVPCALSASSFSVRRPFLVWLLVNRGFRVKFSVVVLHWLVPIVFIAFSYFSFDFPPFFFFFFIPNHIFDIPLSMTLARGVSQLPVSSFRSTCIFSSLAVLQFSPA